MNESFPSGLNLKRDFWAHHEPHGHGLQQPEGSEAYEAVPLVVEAMVDLHPENP